MNTLESSDEELMSVWDWCSDAYLQHGIRLKLPANTDHTKTYQWRYVRAITNKFNEWGFDEPTSRRFIEIAIKHCKDAGVLRKGLAALHQTNLLELCYNELKKKADSNSQSIDSIAYTHTWLNKRSQGDLLKQLLHKNDPDEYCNLVKWVGASRISRLYLALSRVCGRAMSKLSVTHPEERMILPSTAALYILRSEFLEDVNNLSRVKEVLGEDWRKMC